MSRCNRTLDLSAARVAGGRFFDEVSGYLVQEKVFKRHLTVADGGGSPDSTAMGGARSNIRYHLDYIGWLLKERNWLAGERMSYADLAAAAHLSTADYLGDVPWHENESAKNWYARIKSRPSFRPLLSESLPGMMPSPSYANLDFEILARSNARWPSARAKRASTGSATHCRTRSPMPRRICMTGSMPARMATWTGWRRRASGAPIRAYCGPTSGVSWCSD